MSTIKLLDIPLIEKIILAIPIVRSIYKPFKRARRGYDTYEIHVILQLKSGAPVIGTHRRFKILRSRYLADIEFCFPEENHEQFITYDFPRFMTQVSVKRGSEWEVISSEQHPNDPYTLGEKKVARVSLDNEP